MVDDQIALAAMGVRTSHQDIDSANLMVRMARLPSREHDHLMARIP